METIENMHGLGIEGSHMSKQMNMIFNVTSPMVLKNFRKGSIVLSLATQQTSDAVIDRRVLE